MELIRYKIFMHFYDKNENFVMNVSFENIYGFKDAVNV